jgi:hypothetical protein
MAEEHEMMELRLDAVHPLWAGMKDKSKGEGMKVLLTPSGFMLMLVLDPLSADEAEALRAGAFRFGVLKMKGGFCWLLGTPIATFDGPYSAGLAQPELRQVPGTADLATNPALRLAVTVCALDGQGVIRALRFTTVSPQFTRSLVRWHDEGLRDWTGETAWDQEIARFQARYPKPQDAMRHAITCKGGD